ncbi:hypothetical protein TREES_T100000665 [Tupaia chinensis]|uniref:Uncharacterized protein n=1 Tax=Tupaia chinensis TaxID=246437 RepID=L9KP35_TUPCH|nr:hypothetical protein TREES_T100000665 [Tupaia chinensis]
MLLLVPELAVDVDQWTGCDWQAATQAGPPGQDQGSTLLPSPWLASLQPGAPPHQTQTDVDNCAKVLPPRASWKLKPSQGPPRSGWLNPGEKGLRSEEQTGRIVLGGVSRDRNPRPRSGPALKDRFRERSETGAPCALGRVLEPRCGAAGFRGPRWASRVTGNVPQVHATRS